MTRPEKPPTPVRLELLRRAVAERVSATSLRGVAKEVGMSAPGLQSFLNGGMPFEATRRKLSAWYVAKASGDGTGLTPAMAENFLAALVSHLPEDRRQPARRALLARLDSLTRRERTEPPPWLVTLRGAKRRA
jgi:hypothetical protein